MANVLGIDMIYTPPIPYMAVLFLFSVYPAVFSSEKFFKKRGSANSVTEYQYFMKILFTYLVALIVTIVTLYFLGPIMFEQTNNLIAQANNLIAQVRNLTEQAINLLEQSNNREQRNNLLAQAGNLLEQARIRSFVFFSLYTIVFLLPAVLIFILLKLLLEHARKQFRFYYAKACFEMINESKNETDKNGYLLLGLDWYNKFVKRITKGGIDIQTIYSKIVSYAPLSNNMLILLRSHLIAEMN